MGMTLTSADIQKVANLAKIKLTDSEEKKFQTQLSKIVSHIDVLHEVKTDGVEPTSQTTGLENVTRDDDKIQPSLNVNDATSGTKNIHNGYFVVDAILAERSDK